MLRWFRGRKKFSLENLAYLHDTLERNPTVTEQNQDKIVEVLRSIAEVIIWGDQHNKNFFEFFCEKNMISFFMKVLFQKCDVKVKIQIVQTLSILVQNIQDETSVFYLLSNNHINDLIVHRFDFSDEELLAYYISFLKTLSLKLNKKTVHFFFNERANDFPLYTEALQFFKNSEPMVRVAVRTLALNVYRVDYPPLRRFILDCSAVPYFTNLVWFFREQCCGLNDLLRCAARKRTRSIHKRTVESSLPFRQSRFSELAEELLDLYYYLQDILGLGIPRLGHALIDQLLCHFVLPSLIGALKPVDELGSLHELELRESEEEDEEEEEEEEEEQREEKEDVVKSEEKKDVEEENEEKKEEEAEEKSAETEERILSTPPPEVGSSAATPRSKEDILNPCPWQVAAECSENHLEPALAMFLLSQLFTVFHDKSFLNSVLTTLLHEHPPRVALSVIQHPPHYPVKQAIPLASVLYPKLAVHLEEPSACPPVAVTPPVRPFAVLGSGVVPLEQPQDALLVEEEDSRQRSHSVERMERADIPLDENLKARSRLPQLGPVSSPIQSCPNSREPVPENPYRVNFLSYLRSDRDELIFGATTVLLSMLNCKEVDSELLGEIGVCPVRLTKSLQLFKQLIEDDTPPQPTRPALVPASVQRRRSVVLLSLKVDTSGSVALDTQVELEDEETMAPSELGHPLERSGSQSAEHSPRLRTRYRTPTSVLSKSDLKQVFSHPPTAQYGKYPTKLVLLDAHRHRLVTIRVIVELLCELCCHSHNKEPQPCPEACAPTLVPQSTLEGLKRRRSKNLEKTASSARPNKQPPYVPLDPPPPFLLAAHMELLERAYRQAASVLGTKLRNQETSLFVPSRGVSPVPGEGSASPRRAAGLHKNFLLDLIEDEWQNSCLAEQSYMGGGAGRPAHRQLIRDILSSPISLFPVSHHPSSGIPLDYRLPNGALEHSRRAVQVFLVLRRLLFRMQRIPDNDFPLVIASRNAERVPPGSTIQSGQIDPSICCNILSPLAAGERGRAKRAKVILLADSLRHLLLLVEPDRASPGFCTVEFSVSLRHVVATRAQHSTVIITLRASRKPHPSAAILQGTWRQHSRTALYTLALFFGRRHQATTARAFLDRVCSDFRRLLVAQILELLPETEGTEMQTHLHPNAPQGREEAGKETKREEEKSEEKKEEEKNEEEEEKEETNEERNAEKEEEEVEEATGIAKEECEEHASKKEEEKKEEMKETNEEEEKEKGEETGDAGEEHDSEEEETK